MGLKVAVLGGGTSHEADISRSSASQIADALQSKCNVKYIELTPGIALELREFGPDVVFPVLHGAPGEDGTLQGLLDIIELPYVGCGLRASSLAMDKVLAKQQFRLCGLPVLQDVVVARSDIESGIERILQSFGDRVVCKPRYQGSALGITLLPQGGDIRDALLRGFKYDSSMLVEPFVQGREITVGVLDLHGTEPVALPVTEILVAENEWYDFVNRYTPGKSEHVIPAEVDSHTYKRLQDAAIGAHQALGCRDLSRADFVLEQTNDFWLLEVNSMPGMTPTSLYPDACRVHGIDLPELALQLVMSAHRRAGNESTT